MTPTRIAAAGVETTGIAAAEIEAATSEAAAIEAATFEAATFEAATIEADGFVDLTAVARGFASPGAHSQRCFRVLLDAWARPGRIERLALEGLDRPATIGSAMAAILLTLADEQTPVWRSPRLATPQITGFLRFACGCPLVLVSGDAALVCIAADDVGSFDPDAVARGTDELPQLGATVVLEVRSLAAGQVFALSGPGIERSQQLRVGLPSDALWTWRQRLEHEFPRGVDLVLCCGERIVAIPRTTHVELG